MGLQRCASDGTNVAVSLDRRQKGLFGSALCSRQLAQVRRIAVSNFLDPFIKAVFFPETLTVI